MTRQARLTRQPQSDAYSEMDMYMESFVPLTRERVHRASGVRGCVKYDSITRDASPNVLHVGQIMHTQSTRDLHRLEVDPDIQPTDLRLEVRGFPFVASGRPVSRPAHIYDVCDEEASTVVVRNGTRGDG